MSNNTYGYLFYGISNIDANIFDDSGALSNTNGTILDDTINGTNGTYCTMI